MKSKMPSAILAATGILGLLFMLSPTAFRVRAQEKPKHEVIQAQAMGQMRASGKQFSVTINIESYSTPEDQQTLIDAFTKGGHNALVKTLSKMKSKGRVAITGTLGYQIAYIRSFPTENGRTIRLITDRPINIPEATAGTRSKDYDLSGVELNLAQDPKQSTGSLVIAAKFTTDKKTQQITFESYGSGPWRLTNIMER
jgi:hypothetical protein